MGGELLEGFSIESLEPQPMRASSSSKGIRLWAKPTPKVKPLCISPSEAMACFPQEHSLARLKQREARSIHFP